MTVTEAQLQSLATGIDATLTDLQARLITDVLNEKFPLVADGMGTAAAAGEDALEAILELRDTLVTALNVLQTVATQPDTVVEQAINDALAAAGFEGTAVSIDVVGDEVRIGLGTRVTGQYSQSYGTGLGLGFLGLDAGGSATVETGFTFDMDFVTDSSGFYIDTVGDTDITLSLDISDPLFDQAFNIAGQDFVAADAGTTFSGVIEIDLSGASERIGPLDVLTADIDGSFTGTVGLEVGLEAVDQGPLTPPLETTFAVDWTFTDEDINPSDNNANFGDVPELRFDTVAINLGTFMEDFVGPLIERLDQLLEPLRPIISVFTASIKVLENFPGLNGLFDVNNDGKVNLLDIVQIALPKVDLSGLNAVIALAEDVLDWADFLDGAGFADGQLILGDIDLGSIDFRNPSFDFADVTAALDGLADSLESVVNGLSGNGWDTTDVGSGDTGKEILDSILDSEIFDFPILEDPDEWINLLLGRPADLVTVDLPTVEFDTGSKTLFSFPVFLGIFLDVKGRAGLSLDFDFGFDTRGLLDSTLNAIDGFYVVDGPNSEIQLASSVGLFIELDAFVATVGGGGDIEGILDLDLVSGVTEGKLYYDEFIDAVTSNPFSIFDASGSITAGFSAYVDTILGEIWRWDSPRITLGGFGFDDTGEAVLADLTDGELTIYSGGRAAMRSNGSFIGDLPEVISLTPSPTGGFDLSILGMTQNFKKSFTEITGNGQNGADQLVIDAAITAPVKFFGGVDADVLSGGSGGDSLFGGDGDDGLIGNLGDDSLTGAAGRDYLDGGGGADTMKGGDGSDRVTYRDSNAAVRIDFDAASQIGGHAEGDVLEGIENMDGSSFDDTITGSQGSGVIVALDGDDSVTGGTHVQYLYGNDGDDTLESSVAGSWLSGGEGDDTYIVRALGITLGENALMEIGAGSDSGYDHVKGYVNIDLRFMDTYIEYIELFDDAEIAFANDLDNLVEGNANDNSLYGYAGEDTIRGFKGDDSLYGYTGDDSLISGVGDDIILGGSGDDTLFANAGNDDLRGDGGDDSMVGGFGFDTLQGDAGADTMRGGFDADFYIADSLDTIYEPTGGGADYVWADETHSLIAGQEVEVLSAYDWNNQLVPIALAVVVNTYAAFDALALATGLTGTLGSDATLDLTGNEFAQLIIGDVGNGDVAEFENVLEGMGGADTLLGDNRLDYASYDQSGAAVQIDLALEAQVSTGHADGDMIVRIHNIIGSDFGDTILADAGAIARENIFEGGGGADSLNGYSGDDLLSGGNGADTIDGGEGNDTLNGNDGRDSLIGDTGADILDGGEGIDTLNGGNGHDQYYVTLLDRIVDSSGDDTVTAGTDYTLTIGAQIELLEAETNAGDIALFGNTFAQSVTGNKSDNFLHGGGGADTINGKGGQDTAAYTFSLAGVAVDLSAGTASGGHASGDVLTSIENLTGSVFADTLIGLKAATGTGAEDNEHVGGAGADYIEDTHGVNTLRGGNGADTLVGSGEAGLVAGYGSELYGGNGNDSLDAGAVSTFLGDTLIGGKGDDIYRVTSAGDQIDEIDDPAHGHDTVISDVADWSMETDGQAGVEDAELGLGVDLTANALDNFVTGNALDNVLKGREGDDTLEGSGGDDTLRGGEGHDVLRGGVGDDEMYGWIGNDLFFVKAAGDVVIEEAGNGTDTVRASIDYVLPEHVEDLELTGSNLIDGTGNDSANHMIGNGFANVLEGRGGDDTLEGGTGADRLEGQAGADTLVGGAGADTLTGGASADSLEGGDGSDDLAGDGGDDTVLGGAGSDTLEGGDGADDLNGGTDRDSLSGGAGADTLKGESGQDALSGGDDNDRLEGNAGHDNLRGDGGADTLLGGLGKDSLQGGDDADLLQGEGGNDVLSGDAGADTLEGGDGADSLLGGTEADLIDGGAGDDTARGGSGNDTVLGGDGADVIDGGNGSDDLSGEAGADTLKGGGGADRLTGGTESDTFLFEAVPDSTTAARDQIVDFLSGTDLVDLSGIDANSTVAGDQAFAFIGSGAFTAAGQLRFVTNGTDGALLADVNGDGSADFALTLEGVTALIPTDVVL